MKKLIYAICMGAAVAFSSCEDMLDTTNYTEKTTATFPESYDDAQQMIAAWHPFAPTPRDRSFITPN